MALYLARLRKRRRDRRHAVEGAACPLQREGASGWAWPIACASELQRLPRGARALRPHRLGRHVRARRACTTTTSSSPRSNALMTDDGVMLLHSIGHMSPPGTASPWLRKYIFPGAYSPALSEVFTAVEQASLWVTDLEFLRVHYAKTLAHWCAALRGQPRQGRADVRRALLPHVGILSHQRRDDVPAPAASSSSTCSWRASATPCRSCATTSPTCSGSTRTWNGSLA